MRRTLLDIARCPRTGSPLRLEHERGADDVRTGVLVGDGGRYPVVGGVAVLRTEPELTDPVVALLDAGRADDALAHAAFSATAHTRAARLRPAIESWPRLAPVASRVGAFVERRERAGAASATQGDHRAILSWLYRDVVSPSEDAYQYFLHRFGIPRHLVGLAAIEAADPPREVPVLDVGCGGGHLTFGLANRFGALNVVAVDRELPLLLVAARLNPEVEVVCADAVSLPFADSTFGLVFSSDVLSYVADKRSAVRESVRVVGDGTVLMTSVRNGLVEHVHGGMALSPGAWRSLVDGLDHRLIGDESILRRYLAGSGLDPTADHPDEKLRPSQTLTIVASSGDVKLRETGPFTTWQAWPHARGQLGVNPLLRPERVSAAGVELVQALPTETFAADNPLLATYLPARHLLSMQAMDAGRRGRPDGDLDEAVAMTVVLGMPPDYVERSWPS